MTTEQKVIRKLSAILSADVKGYSRLMTDDEASTIKTLKDYRVVMSDIIKQHSGRVVDAPGDNVLAEFPSAVNAIQCSVEIQNALKEKNTDLPVDKRLVFRIGVNIGDVVQDGDSLYGEGVNIAARIEGLANPGGVCISRNAYDHIKNKLKLGYEYIGEHAVKNIKDPVRVYKVLMEPEDAGKLIGEKSSYFRKKWPRLALAAVVILVSIIVWQFYYQKSPNIEAASVENMAFPLPEKPSIAVLAFDNMTGDPAQDYFSDGLTEEIITALSKIGSMFVIARNTTFTYKGKPVKVKQVAEDLGVRYVLEGSVRKTEDRLRITAQLIDALKGHHLWAERYDRDLKDIFVIQDDITKKIITALNVKLTGKQYSYAYAKGTDNLQAYLKLLQLGALVHRSDLKESNVLKRQLAEEAIALDLNYAWAYDYLGWTHLNDIYYGMTKDFAKSWKTAFELGQKAQSLDEKTANTLLGSLYLLKGQYDKGVAEAERFVEFFPNDSNAQFTMGRFLMAADRVEKAIPFYKKALRLDPYAIAPYFYNLGAAYWMMGQYEEAISECKKGLQRFPDDLFTHMVLVVSYIETGNVEGARKSAAEVLRINPKISLDWCGKILHWKNKDIVARWIDDLRKVGLK
ncbi:MAG: adenylate/guanylate cyclase domain-containing protein [Bacteroidota bacterium]